jgi:1-acyl-sn-glycerol-3-phosphate acyltransferase
VHAFFVKVNRQISKWFRFCIKSDLKIYDKENILKEPAIYAIRHESAWETLVLMSIIPKASFVIKYELTAIPLFKEISRRLKMIAIDRKEGRRSISIMLDQTQDRLKEQFNVLIFPEGTRMPKGTFDCMRTGIYAIYRHTNAKVVPVALNSGEVWPRRSFLKYPGCIKVKFMPHINPGLNKVEFMSLLEKGIRLGTVSLYEQ